MRKIIFLLVTQFVLFSCQKSKVMEGQEIRIPLECNTSMEFSIHHLHLFAIDRDNRIARHETFTSSDIHENTLHATLPLGRYRLALVPRETWLFRKSEKHLKTCSFAYHMKKTLTKRPVTSPQLYNVSVSQKIKMPFPRSGSSGEQEHYRSLSTQFQRKYPT